MSSLNHPLGPCIRAIEFYIVDLVSDNLPKVRALIHNACTKWYDLGLELGVEKVTLDIIRTNYHDETETCFREMLSEWLNMIDPRPSWEALIAALKQPYIGHEELAKKVRKEQGIPEEPADAAQQEAVSKLHGNGSLTHRYLEKTHYFWPDILLFYHSTFYSLCYS